MANQQKDDNDAPITLTLGMLKEMMTTLVVEMKKPHVDPDIVARNLAAKARLRAQREESAKDLAAIQDNCAHLRPDNSANIAWIENFHRARNLFIQEGFCQLCNKHFHPGVPGYAEILRLPRGRVGLIY